MILESFDHPGVDESFVLANDHDPKPLYHRFEAEAGPEFRWEYRQREPGEFRVVIGKAEATTADAAEGETEAPFRRCLSSSPRETAFRIQELYPIQASTLRSRGKPVAEYIRTDLGRPLTVVSENWGSKYLKSVEDQY